MRVMIVGPYPRSAERIDGGVAAAVTYLSQALVRERGVELIGVRVVKDDGGPSFYETLGWPVVNLPLGRLSVSTLYRRQFRSFRQVVAKYRPDIVHGQGADVAGFLAVGSPVPSVVTVHGLLGECARQQTNFVAKTRDHLQGLLTEKSTVRRARDLIAISPYVARYYEKEIRGRIHEIPNAVASRFFAIQRAPEQGRLLFAGRISRGKGVMDLVRAVARCGTAEKVVLAGAAPDRAFADGLHSEVRRLGLSGRVEFAGLLDESSLLAEFARAEALVLPSYQETAPMVVQQAMAAGLAVIATNVGGIPFQVEHDATGLLFEAGDIEQLVGLLARLRTEPSLSRRLGAAGRAVAMAHYDAGEVASMTRRAYERILGDE